MSQHDQLLRSIIASVAKEFGLPISGIIRAKSGEIIMQWEWDQEMQKPRRVGSWNRL